MMPNNIVAPNDSLSRKIITNNSATGQQSLKALHKVNETKIFPKINKGKTHVIKMQRSPNSVFPKIWLEGYNRQPSPSFAADPMVQNGPTETP